MDLLGFFLTQGLWMADEQFKTINIVAVSGFSDKIDEYVFRRWDCQEETAKPSVLRPDGFDDVVDSIESLPHFHKTDCAIGLLELSGAASLAFMQAYNSTKQKTLADQLLHSFSLEGDEELAGISFISVPTETEFSFLSQRAEAFGILKKYAERSSKWIALGWRQGSYKSMDVAFWLTWQWEHDDKMEDVAKEIPRGSRITL